MAMTSEQKLMSDLHRLEEDYIEADWAVMNDPLNQHWWHQAKAAAKKLDSFCKRHGFNCIARNDFGELAY